MGPGTIRCLAHSALPMLDEAVRLVRLAVIRSSRLSFQPLCAWLDAVTVAAGISFRCWAGCFPVVSVVFAVVRGCFWLLLLFLLAVVRSPEQQKQLACSCCGTLGRKAGPAAEGGALSRRPTSAVRLVPRPGAKRPEEQLQWESTICR